jgi:hypothetical protein
MTIATPITSKQPQPQPQPRKTRGANKPKAKTKSLVSKLAEVTLALDTVVKTGFNKFQNYSYVEESQVLQVLRREIAERQIMIFSSVDEVVRDGALTAIKTTYRIVDGESGEEQVMRWAGNGQSSSPGPFALYGAMTGSTKYFLMKLFLLPTGDEGVADDVEHNAHNSPDPQPDMASTLKRMESIAQVEGVAGLQAEWKKPKHHAYKRWCQDTPEGQAAHKRTKDLAKAADKTKRAPVTDDMLQTVGRDAFGITYDGDEE